MLAATYRTGATPSLVGSAVWRAGVRGAKNRRARLCQTCHSTAAREISATFRITIVRNVPRHVRGAAEMDVRQVLVRQDGAVSLAQLAGAGQERGSLGHMGVHGWVRRGHP